MAKLKRYDLYEGDDDLISLPGKQPLGRDKDLQARDEYDRRTAEEAKKKRYFASNEKDDGLGAPSSLFDDFDRFESPAPVRNSRPKYKKKAYNRGAWAAVIVTCLLLLAGMGILVVPQLTGLRYKFLPNLAFVNGNLIGFDSQRAENFSQERRAMFTERIYPGTFIDNVQVDGMTREEAVRAVTAVHQDQDRAFDITVTVGNESWHVNSERVPVFRNTEETVERAWAAGRSNTASLSAGDTTPFQERVRSAARS